VNLSSHSIKTARACWDRSPGLTAISMPNGLPRHVRQVKDESERWQAESEPGNIISIVSNRACPVLSCLRAQYWAETLPIPFGATRVFAGQNPKVRAKIVKAMIGMSQQKKAMIKQRLTSSVSIFFTSPYLTIRIVPRAPIPTTTIDQPTINHTKNSDKRTSYTP